MDGHPLHADQQLTLERDRAAVSARPEDLPASASWRHLGATGWLRGGILWRPYQRLRRSHRRRRGWARPGRSETKSSSTTGARLPPRLGPVRTRPRESADLPRLRSVDGLWTMEIPELAGCLDIDLESSACTNTMPIDRLDLAVSRAAVAPAGYIRAHGLAIERLEQEFCRVADEG